MSVPDMAAAVALVAGRVETEASGNVTLENIGRAPTPLRPLRRPGRATCFAPLTTPPNETLNRHRRPPPRGREIGKAGVTFVSSGAITHSVKALDISLNIEGDWAKRTVLPT